MTSFREDPINEAVYGPRGIMGAIDLLFEKGRIIPGVMMIMCGIDIMSNLDRKDGKKHTSADFKKWVGTYIHLPGDDALSPDDIWRARCALLHTYGVFSRDVRSGSAKAVIWLQNPLTPVGYAPDIDPHSIRVDPFVFKKAFSDAVGSFLSSALSESERKSVIEGRLKELVTYSHFIDERLAYQGE